MGKRIRAVLALAALAAGVAAGPPAGPPGREDAELERLLRRLDRISKLYRDNALRFTCDETVTVYGNAGRSTHRYRYIYVYDERRGLRDYRTSRRGGKPLRNDETQAALLRAYSWIYIFEQAHHDFYRYENAGEQQVLERPALGIRFIPVPPHTPEVNDWVGTAWFDRKTLQPLRVEARTVEHHGRWEMLQENLRRAAEADGSFRSSHLVERIHTEFSEEKNGMRFPGEVLIQMSRFEVRGGRGDSGYREYPVYRVRQSYGNYRFFGVRTQEEIERIVDE